MNASDVEKVQRPHLPSPFAGDQALVQVVRADYVESVHRGSIAVVDTAGTVLAGAGDVHEPVFLRSGAKPFQVMPAVLAGGIDRWGITEQELAVLCSSHNGEPRHIEAVHSVLAKIGLDESALTCGIHPPLSVEAAADRWRHGLEPSPACNNCSGSHAGMLLACRAHGWSIDNYGDPNHPLQRDIRNVITQFGGLEDCELEEGIDMCAVPTYRVPLWRAACMFARLASGSGASAELSRAACMVRSAMTTYPGMVGGEDRFDTDLMTVAGGALVAKGGADGFQGIGHGRTGVGVALKISDGNATATTAASMRVLEDRDLLSPMSLHELDKYREPKVVNRQGTQVGRVFPAFHLRELQ